MRTVPGPMTGRNRKTSEETGNEKPAKPRSKKPLIILAIVVVVARPSSVSSSGSRIAIRCPPTMRTPTAMWSPWRPRFPATWSHLWVDDNTPGQQGRPVAAHRSAGLPDGARQRAGAARARARRSSKRPEDALRIARVQYPAQLVSAEAQQRVGGGGISRRRRHPMRASTRSIGAPPRRRASTRSTSQQLSTAANLKSAQGAGRRREAGSRTDSAGGQCGGGASGAGAAGRSSIGAGRT